MKFVLVGYGRVGIRTANILKEEDHEVVIVDSNPEKVELARSRGFEVYAGSGDDDSVLKAAGIETANAVGGLTGDLTVNLSACVIADRYGCRTVLRIDDDYHADIYEKYAAEVDAVVYPERLGAAGAKTALQGGDFDVLGDLTENLSAGTVTVGKDAGVIGEQVRAVDLPEEVLVYAHGRAGEPMTIPLPQTTIEAGDQIAFMAAPTEVDAVQQLFGGTESPPA
ncbi:potassium channel family protein [Halocatena halophila]|uniref:potassium channel family protein n=1 Tax=Halocatena halophila TaxID=2814576 RepID=UPI002ED3849B